MFSSFLIITDIYHLVECIRHSYGGVHITMMKAFDRGDDFATKYVNQTHVACTQKFYLKKKAITFDKFLKGYRKRCWKIMRRPKMGNNKQAKSLIL